MTYATAAQARFGFFLMAAWRRGWDAAAASNPLPGDARHKTERTRQAEEAGYRDHQEATTGNNWIALGVAY